MSKPALRERMRAARAAFPPTVIPAWPEFTDRLPNDDRFIVASYRPLPGEADPGQLDFEAWAEGCMIVFPRIVRRSEPMRFHVATARDHFETGPLGIQQPLATQRECLPDVILTPLLAFDRRGNRLGQGAGYYDRAFAALPTAWRVGVAWSIQEVDHLPTDAWDVPLHAVATEKEWITP